MNTENKLPQSFTTSIYPEDSTLYQVAFKMKLFKGQGAVYKKILYELLPDLQPLLKVSGISDYSIFLDEITRSLEALDNLQQCEVMQKCWQYMGDIMESDFDNSPVSIPLKEMFYFTSSSFIYRNKNRKYVTE